LSHIPTPISTIHKPEGRPPLERFHLFPNCGIVLSVRFYKTPDETSCVFFRNCAKDTKTFPKEPIRPVRSAKSARTWRPFFRKDPQSTGAQSLAARQSVSDRVTFLIFRQSGAVLTLSQRKNMRLSDFLSEIPQTTIRRAGSGGKPEIAAARPDG